MRLRPFFLGADVSSINGRKSVAHPVARRSSESLTGRKIGGAILRRPQADKAKPLRGRGNASLDGRFFLTGFSRWIRMLPLRAPKGRGEGSPWAEWGIPHFPL